MQNSMQMITLLNEKGGVGKTTQAVHIAAGLAVMGKRVVLVDADAQGHATISYGLAKEPGLYDLLVRDADFQTILRTVPQERYAYPGEVGGGALYVVPSNVETRSIANGVGDDLWLFQERFAELEGLIDVVVVDTSPTPSLLHGLIYMATDYLIYPTELENLSIDGLAQSIQHKAKANTSRMARGLDEIKVLGIQPTMYRRKTDVHDYNLQELLKSFKQMVWPAIPQRTVWAERAEAKKAVWTYRPKSLATLEAWAMVERTAKGLGI
jgi:chromosome partitioning protein